MVITLLLVLLMADLIQNGSILQEDLQQNSVGQAQLEENAVADNEIDYSQVTLDDFDNDTNFVAISGDLANLLTKMAPFIMIPTKSRMLTNTTNLSNHIAVDLDTDSQNENIMLSTDNSVTITQTGNDFDLSVDFCSDIDGSGLTGEILTIGIEDGTSEDVDLSSFALDTDVAAALPLTH